MDLPPPSYEAATGNPGIHNQRYPYSKSVSPTAPSLQDDEIITVDPDTRPIFPRPYRSNPLSNVQPNNQNLDPEISPKPKSQHLNRYRKEECSPFMCYFVIFIFVVCALVVIIGLLRANEEKPKYDFSQISENHHNTDNEWQEKWMKDNEHQIRALQDRVNKILEDPRNNPYLGNND